MKRELQKSAVAIDIAAKNDRLREIQSVGRTSNWII